MPNPQRGDIAAILDGRQRTLRLTLGAIAELEAALGASGILGLAERLEQGDLTARQAIGLIGAGLRGAGSAVTDAEVAAMVPEGGASGTLRLVTRLLEAAFPKPAQGA